MSNHSGISSAALRIAFATVLFAAPFVVAQAQAPSGAVPDKKAARIAAPETPAGNTKSKAWTMLRTPEGHPDLHGYWTSLTFTPLERPAQYGNREFLTGKETKAVFNAGVHRTFDSSGDEPQGELFNPNSA